MQKNDVNFKCFSLDFICKMVKETQECLIIKQHTHACKYTFSTSLLFNSFHYIICKLPVKFTNEIYLFCCCWGQTPISSNYLEYPPKLGLVQMQPYWAVSLLPTFCTSQDRPTYLFFHNLKWTLCYFLFIIIINSHRASRRIRPLFLVSGENIASL